MKQENSLENLTPESSEITINLKLYGLPRTYTNWVAYNIMKTYPEIKVWHNNSPLSPNAEAFWKHGEIRRIKGMNGYILVNKVYKEWKRSMIRYLPLNTISMDQRFLKFLWDGWWHSANQFHTEDAATPVFLFCPESSEVENVRKEMDALYMEIVTWFKLPYKKRYYEKKRMWRSGDAYPLDHYLTEEDYETS